MTLMLSELDFSRADHTLILSDIHLADAEKPHPKNPLWKRFKLPQHFIDEEFKCFLESMVSQIESPVELILNGDIFDFDSVMDIPKDPEFKVSWLERLRGLSSEEMKSRYKMDIILGSHPVWVDALGNFIRAGNRLIFVIGNHDLELHWPSVQEDILNRLKISEEQRKQVRFCEWFYISNQDTLVEHGNQYDAYCLCSNPIHPLIKKGSKIVVRLPFGNLAGKYMINGMGLMNPHANASFIKESFWDYIKFYFKYVVRTEPLLMWTWFWGASATLIVSLTEGFLPAMRDPLTVNVRMEEIARKANAPVLVVLALKEVHVHPGIFNPFKILRELWLDRVLLLVLLVFGSLQLFFIMNAVTPVRLWWSIVPLVLFFPLFIFYARSVQSEVDATQKAAYHMAPLSARIARVQRIVQGHTHMEAHTDVDQIEVINTGTWSPAYHDVECTQPYGSKCFAWIRPKSPGEPRIAELFKWEHSKAHKIDRTIL